MLLALAGVFFLVGCVDNRIRKEPGWLLKDTPVDPNLWNNIAFDIWRAIKLQHEQKLMDQRYGLNIFIGLIDTGQVTHNTQTIGQGHIRGRRTCDD